MATQRIWTITSGLVLLATAAAGCSSERLVEEAASRIDGVGDVSIDEDAGSLSITDEDGEDALSFDVDEDGTASWSTSDGAMTAGEARELPEAIASVFTPPSGFTPAVNSEWQDDDTDVIHTQGELTGGGFGELLDQLEAAVEAGPWDEVTRTIAAEDVMGTIQGTTQDGRLLQTSLIVDPESDEAMVQVMLATPR